MKFEEYFESVYLINMDKRPDRLEISLRDELPRIGLSQVMRFAGLVYENIENPWVRGAYGCAMSHVSCLHDALNKGTHAFMFEDDVHFADIDGLPEILENAIDELRNTDWKLFYLGGNLLKPCYQQTDHLARLTHCQSTVAWGCNFNFIEELLNYIPTDRFQYPIDVILADGVIPNNESYITIPMICGQRKDHSDIEGQVVDYESYLWDRYNSNLILKKS